MWLQLYIIDMLKSFHIWYIEFFRPGKQEGAENCKDWFLTWPEAPVISQLCKRYWLCHTLNSHLVLDELLLDPCEAELSVAVIILRREVTSNRAICQVVPDLITIPAHHIKNVEDSIGVAVDTIKDGVTVSRPMWECHHFAGWWGKHCSSKDQIWG